jgi:single-stranded DNA-specific DHH superfamily exonuclease
MVILSASTQQRTLIVPDKDADGLSSGVIIHRTLVKLGLDQTLLSVHLVHKGSNIHEEAERKAMLDLSPKYVIVVDQGSRGGPPVVNSKDVKCMIIDHHLSNEFPENAVVSDIKPIAWGLKLIVVDRVRMPLSSGRHIIFANLRNLQRA